MPFYGGDDDFDEALRSLARLRTIAGDQILLVDNTAVAGRRDPAGLVEVLTAPLEQSSYYARNVGAEHATSEWIVFIDSDCIPEADLLDHFFAEPVPGAVAILVGGVGSEPAQTGLIARYARERDHISERWHVERTTPHPSGPTANLAVRREAWDAVGGFFEGVRSGEDVEFCFRLQDAGWELIHRPEARVDHVHPTQLRPMLKKARRHAAGRTWVRRRYPTAYDPFRAPARIARSVGGTLAWALTLRFERSAFKVLDGLRTVAEADGLYRGDNRAARAEQTARKPADAVVMVDGFPARSETFVYNEVEAMRDLGLCVSVVSSARPALIERTVARRESVTHLEDEPALGKLAAVARLFIRHPIRCGRDLAERRRWRREEEVWPLAALAPLALRLSKAKPHLHAHFAAGASLHTMRLAKILGLRYSVTAHAFDIFQKPRNLREKLERADLATSESDYAVEHLRGLVDARHREHIVRVATGVRPELFNRESELPADGYVLAIGRLIEKKGFRHLIDAVAGISESERPQVVIAGDGPLRRDLEGQVDDLGLGDWIELRANVWGPGPVREVLEGAACLCAPSVIAADGDRDDMPVVIYEALAMEVPVVASDLVGIPEVVKEGWGRLVPPGDPVALGEALKELLSRTPSERREMGSRGREFVVAERSQRDETARLAEMIRGLGAR
jgi:glycosyltransferase involved in cell wall biosynthesis